MFKKWTLKSVQVYQIDILPATSNTVDKKLVQIYGDFIISTWPGNWSKDWWATFHITALHGARIIINPMGFPVAFSIGRICGPTTLTGFRTLNWWYWGYWRYWWYWCCIWIFIEKCIWTLVSYFNSVKGKDTLVWWFIWNKIYPICKVHLIGIFFSLLINQEITISTVLYRADKYLPFWQM